LPRKKRYFDRKAILAVCEVQQTDMATNILLTFEHRFWYSSNRDAV
jgi:hypothetical protein